MVAEPLPRPEPTPPTLPDPDLIDALANAKAEAERTKAEYEKLQYEVLQRIHGMRKPRETAMRERALTTHKRNGVKITDFCKEHVRRFNAVMRSPIDIYAEEATLDFLKRVELKFFCFVRHK